jgi:hypothetical protein
MTQFTASNNMSVGLKTGFSALFLVPCVLFWGHVTWLLGLAYTPIGLFGFALKMTEKQLIKAGASIC